MGWVANLFLILGHLILTYRPGYSFICFIVGNTIWACVALMREPFQPDMFAISFFFICISVWNLGKTVLGK